MKTVHDVLRDRLLKRAGLFAVVQPKYSMSSLERSEWNPYFERLMRNRLIMGALRYGKLDDPDKCKNYDLLEAIEDRVKRFRETGNTELLVDIANFALLEFTCGKHPLKHFNALDSGAGNKHHVRKLKQDLSEKEIEPL